MVLLQVYLQCRGISSRCGRGPRRGCCRGRRGFGHRCGGDDREHRHGRNRRGLEVRRECQGGLHGDRIRGRHRREGHPGGVGQPRSRVETVDNHRSFHRRVYRPAGYRRGNRQLHTGRDLHRHVHGHHDRGLGYACDVARLYGTRYEGNERIKSG